MIGRSRNQTAIKLVTLTLVFAAVSILFMRGAQQIPVVSVVPADFAETRGAATWDARRKDSFLKDEKNQWPLTEAQKKARGNRSPLAWLPELEQCRYISRFVEVAQRYDLDGNPAEMQQLLSQRQRCYTQFQ